jgi:hypothetical protein
MFMIERKVPGVGSMSADELKKLASESCAILETMGPKIGWMHSFVTSDVLFCVYHSENEDLLREHAVKGGFPISKVSAVHTTFDKTILESTSAYGPNSVGPVNAAEFTADPRPKFMVVRPCPSTQAQQSHAELQIHAKACRDACRTLGLHKLLWDHSYDTESGLYEVYVAPSEEVVVEHTNVANFLKGETARITAVISPATADQA